MIEIATEGYRICVEEAIPSLHKSYLEYAELVESFSMEDTGQDFFFVAVGPGNQGWPSLVVQQRYSPGQIGGFHPGICLIPETGLLFIGAGPRLLAYELSGPRRLWEDVTDCGFWSWARHGDFVVLAAELEIAAWDVRGRKLWTRFVEPPWSYEVRSGTVYLDIMGEKSEFPLATGGEHGLSRTNMDGHGQ